MSQFRCRGTVELSSSFPLLSCLLLSHILLSIVELLWYVADCRIDVVAVRIVELLSIVVVSAVELFALVALPLLSTVELLRFVVDVRIVVVAVRIVRMIEFLWFVSARIIVVI